MPQKRPDAKNAPENRPDIFLVISALDSVHLMTFL
jgi:hypothetical protein